jgi:hypothetical protein
MRHEIHNEKDHMKVYEDDLGLPQQEVERLETIKEGIVLPFSFFVFSSFVNL